MAEPKLAASSELKSLIKTKKTKSGGFESLGLVPNIYNGVKRKGYIVPTPIQRKTMPLILSNYDVVAMARTGSGKTAAFLIPMLQKLQQHAPQEGVRALILSPTRDLALQTFKFTKDLGRYTDLRTSLLVGGDSMESQFEDLSQNPDVIIATPGRLMHHLEEIEDMSLRTVQYVVFDEADCLFSMGFAEQLHRILEKLGENRQTLLFSATMPSALAEFARAGLRDPQVVRLDLETKISPDLKLAFFTLRQEEKHAALLYLIREQISAHEQTLVFVSTKYHVDFINTLLLAEGIVASVCYGDMDQDARKINVSKFRSRKTMLLIVTDVAARGIDIPLLDNVINFDFPPKPKLFVHRVGRAARAGRKGTAFSFLTRDEMPNLLDLHLFLSKPIRPAATEEEVLQDKDAALAKMEQAISNGETIYGRFPQAVLDLTADRVREIIDSSEDLYAMLRPCAKAYALYTKTKEKPARESIKRVKKLSREGLHPMFNHMLGGDELTALAFSERLKSFRPKQTVLEAEGDNARAKNQKGSARQWIDVMKIKRRAHEEVINKFQEQRSRELAENQKELEPDEPDVEEDLPVKKQKQVLGVKRKVQSFKDDENFISSVPINQHFEAGLALKSNGFDSNRLDSAVLDLDADNKTGLQQQKSNYHWDKRGKKYIKLNSGDRVTASGKIKTESGAKVKANKKGIYTKWKKETNKKVSLRGTNDDVPAGPAPSSSGGGFRGDNRRFKGGRNQKSSVPNAHVPSEIKDLEQVRKERQKKADKISYLKSKPNNNKGRKKMYGQTSKNGKSGKSGGKSGKPGGKPGKKGGGKGKAR